MATSHWACALLLAAFCGFVATTPLLGAKQCTQGPAFWCHNITNAKGCNAVKHCIKVVWERQTVPEDNDDICKICTDMVKQARDQLESNQTQEDLKAVFEGSCKLIPVKVVTDECIKLVDDFIPELVETLASQMNPQVVCSVAGLCNNANIDKLLDEMKKNNDLSLENKKNVETCNSCYTVVDKMRKNFDASSYEGFLENSLRACGKLGSLSDGCATAVFTHYEDLYKHVQDYFNSENMCHLAGTCAYKYHRHEPSSSSVEQMDTVSGVEITPMGIVGRLDKDVSDDVPCHLCEQLVVHLRDVLIANTTEAEFKKVLEGLCKQSGSFSKECLSIADQYYPVIYDFLLRELDPTDVCYFAGLCTKGVELGGPVAPLVPVHVGELAVRVLHKGPNKPLIGKDESNSFKNQANVQVLQPELAQLPIDRMMVQLPQSKEVCTFCQYFLHFLQVQISDAHTEENIKAEVEKACKMLPTSVASECDAFVEAYGNAVIALLVQEIDPSQVCPALTLCPRESTLPKIDVLMATGKESQSNCPLCLFAVEQLESLLKDNKTEESIQNALDNLCSHLPSNLKSECVDFVDTYSKQLVEMLTVEFTPQEICVYLKLCVDKHPDTSMLSKIDQFHSKKIFMADRNNFRKPVLPKHMLANAENEKDSQIRTNKIADSTINGKPLIYADVTIKQTPQCVICEFIMTQLEKELKDKATDDQIKKAVHSVCNHMPKNVAKECNDFVTKYADLVIDLLAQELSPADVCSVLKLCDGKNMFLQSSVVECAICKEVIGVLQQILSNPSVDRNFEHLIGKTCYAVPDKYYDNCINLMRKYGEELIKLLSTELDTGIVCSAINICGKNDRSSVEIISQDETFLRNRRSNQKLLGSRKCTWGPSYWCENEDQANECHALEHCQKTIWLAEKPKK